MKHSQLICTALLALSICLPVQAAQTGTDDYLTPELRRDVEALKKAYQAKPTTRGNYNERAMTAWHWLNAYSLTGKSLPVNMTQSVRPGVKGKIGKGVMAGLDYYLDELVMLDEHPGALGSLTSDNLGPFESKSLATLRQQYTVGNKAIITGGGFLVARHFRPGYGVYQTNDPAADNYVTIKSSNERVTFRADEFPLAGMHGGFRGADPALMFRVAEGTLEPGDVVTFTYGDVTGGGRGLQMNSASSDYMPFPIYVDFDGSNHVYALPELHFKVSGTTVAGVHGFAPSVLRPGEIFTLSVRAQDRYYNRAKAPVPAFIVFANGQEIGRTPAGDDAIRLIDGLSFASEGVYRITIASGDGEITGVGNPILVSKDARKVFWGETHGHSGFAEGIDTPDRFMQWARDDARLDFVTHSEHDIWMDDFEWQVLIDNVNKYTIPGQFEAFLGYEWTTQNIDGGHHNVLFRNRGQYQRMPNQLYPTLSSLYAALRASVPTDDVLVIPHAHQAGDYRQSDPELENLVEIMSQHGTFEWFGRMYLKYGHQVGFIAASDNHLAQPGYTSAKPGYMSQRGGLAAVMAKDKSRDAIFDAMKSLNTYATTGDKIILDVKVNDTAMGQRAPFAEQRIVKGRVVGTAPIDAITIIKNDVEVWQKDYLTQESGRFSDDETFYVSFDSASVPMHPGDNPRGTRGWHGTLQVTGADLVDFSATDFLNSDFNQLERDEANPALLHFSTGTRGDTSSIQLKLKNIKRRAQVKIALKPATEQGSPARFRPTGTSPASVVELSFADLKRGETHQVLPFDVYNDRVTLRRVIKDGPMDVRFTFEDAGASQGDYYFVRVKQANDAMAWSSPIWIGGFPSR